MQNIKIKLYRVIFGSIITLLIIFSVLFMVSAIPSKLTVSNTSESQEIFIKLSEFKSFRGSFVASDDNLNRIEVLLKNPNLESRDELVIAITDFEKTIYEQKFTGFNFGDTSRARLDFKSISGSKNIKYTVNIIPTKIVDGKLSIGVQGNNLDMIQYYNKAFNIKYSLKNAFALITNPVFLLPLITVSLFLW